MAAITNTNTKIGATARNPRTKILPKKPAFSAKLICKTGSNVGEINASTIPSNKPIEIRLTKLPWKNKENKRDVFIVNH